jgi:excisionase family DNA binding protein
LLTALVLSPWRKPVSEKLLTRSQVAELLSVSVRTVDRLRAEGLLPAVRVLTSVRFREDVVRGFIHQQQGGK